MDTFVLGGFQPFSLSDFPGRAAAIVFTQGCNWRCPFCHNPALWGATPWASDVESAATVLTFLKKRKDRLGGVVVTGGEPTLQPGLAKFIQSAKTLGLAVKLDTNGSRPEVIDALLDRELVDYIAMDVKAPVGKYDQLCGCAVDMDAIRRSRDLIAGSGVAHHFRTTFYKDLLTEIDIAAIKAWLPPDAAFELQACKAPPSR